MARLTTGTMSVGILAVLVGLVGAYGLRSMLLKEKVVAEPPPPAVVPLAAIDLPMGRTITLGDVALVEMTQAQMIERKYNLAMVMLNPSQIIGRTLREEIKQGSPFLTASLFLEGDGPDVSKLLKPGYRATNLTISDRTAVLPAVGDAVDIVFRSKSRDAGGNATGKLDIPEATLTLLEAVEVVAVNKPSAAPQGDPNMRDLRRNGPQAAPPPVVTLAVTLEQANVLKTVEGRGDLSLVVRSPGDLAAGGAMRGKMTLEELLKLKPRPIPFTSEIYRGSRRQTLTFDRGLVADETFGGAFPPPPSRAAAPQDNPYLSPADEQQSPLAPAPSKGAVIPGAQSTNR